MARLEQLEMGQPWPSGEAALGDDQATVDPAVQRRLGTGSHPGRGLADRDYHQPRPLRQRVALPLDPDRTSVEAQSPPHKLLGAQLIDDCGEDPLDFTAGACRLHSGRDSLSRTQRVEDALKVVR